MKGFIHKCLKKSMTEMATTSCTNIEHILNEFCNDFPKEKLYLLERIIENYLFSNRNTENLYEEIVSNTNINFAVVISGVKQIAESYGMKNFQELDEYFLRQTQKIKRKVLQKTTQKIEPLGNFRQNSN